MSNVKPMLPNLANAKWKQYGWIALAVLLLFVSSYLFLAEDPGAAATVAKDNRNATTSTMLVAGQQVDAKDVWIGKAGQDLLELKNSLTKKTQEDKEVSDRVVKLEAMAAQLNKGAATALPVAAYPQGVPSGVSGAIPAPLPPPQPAIVAPGTTSLGRVSASGSVFGNGLGNGLGAGQNFDSQPETVIGRVSLRGVSTTAPSDGVAVSAATTKQGLGTNVSGVSGGNAAGSTGLVRHVGSNFLPIGFAKARILGGLDAPTNGQAQSEPLPLVLEIVDFAILPNQFRANTKQCLLIGQAWGDISSERAYGRIETLSCIRHDGSVLEVAAKGSVYGEDGKYGIRGNLVSKQGQILANALFAGVISGIGQGIQFRSTSNTVTPLGATISTPNQNQGFEAGFGGGLGKAMDQLAGYYVKLAEKTFPIIEIDAGRIVDVAFTKGITLDVALPDEYPMAAIRSKPNTVRGANSDVN